MVDDEDLGEGRLRLRALPEARLLLVVEVRALLPGALAGGDGGARPRPRHVPRDLFLVAGAGGVGSPGGEPVEFGRVLPARGCQRLRLQEGRPAHVVRDALPDGGADRYSERGSQPGHVLLHELRLEGDVGRRDDQPRRRTLTALVGGEGEPLLPRAESRDDARHEVGETLPPACGVLDEREPFPVVEAASDDRRHLSLLDPRLVPCRDERTLSGEDPLRRFDDRPGVEPVFVLFHPNLLPRSTRRS